MTQTSHVRCLQADQDVYPDNVELCKLLARLHHALGDTRGNYGRCVAFYQFIDRLRSTYGGALVSSSCSKMVALLVRLPVEPSPTILQIGLTLNLAQLVDGAEDLLSCQLQPLQEWLTSFARSLVVDTSPKGPSATSVALHPEIFNFDLNALLESSSISSMCLTGAWCEELLAALCKLAAAVIKEPLLFSALPWAALVSAGLGNAPSRRTSCRIKKTRSAVDQERKSRPWAPEAVHKMRQEACRLFATRLSLAAAAFKTALWPQAAAEQLRGLWDMYRPHAMALLQVGAGVAPGLTCLHCRYSLPWSMQRKPTCSPTHQPGHQASHLAAHAAASNAGSQAPSSPPVLMPISALLTAGVPDQQQLQPQPSGPQHHRHHGTAVGRIKRGGGAHEAALQRGVRGAEQGAGGRQPRQAAAAGTGA